MQLGHNHSQHGMKLKKWGVLQLVCLGEVFKQ